MNNEQAQIHELKTDPDVFAAVWAGSKTHEIRINDRDFAVGDRLVLHETKDSGADMATCGLPLAYTGRSTQRTISHIQTGYGLADGWCILSFAAPADRPSDTGGNLSASAERGVEYIMAAVSSFGSEWSLVGSSFDKGDMLEQAEGTLARIQRMLEDDARKLAAALATPVAAIPAPVELSATDAARIKDSVAFASRNQTPYVAPCSWKDLVDKAVEVLGRHIVPDGISDHDAMVELYGIFDGPEYREAIPAAGSGAVPDLFSRGVIAALGVLNACGYSHGSVFHDEIVKSVGEAEIYAAAEDEDYEWAGLDPAKRPTPNAPVIA